MQPATGRPLISVVTPCFNEEDNIAECHEAIRRIFEAELAGCDHEHIFCDNASTDRTVPILREIAARDPRVKVIVNSRNFGLFASLFNGLMHTRGDAVIPLFVADLQDPPELIPEFVRRWHEGYQVVHGIKARREEGLVMRSIRKLYYRLVNRFAEIDIPVDVSEFGLIDRAVVEALRGFDDYYPYLRGMIGYCGFRVTGVPYTWRARKRGRSKFRFHHLLDQGLNGLMSFTKLPMRLCMMLGLTVALLSIAWSIFSLFYNFLYYRKVLPPGIQSLIVAVFFFSGLQLFFFGILGEYIAAIHFQVRKRPLVVVRERINFCEGEARLSPGPAAGTIKVPQSSVPPPTPPAEAR
jgi:glycosyltransferase involved in cell wall biosynthesis